MKLIPSLLPSNLPKGLRLAKAKNNGNASAIYFQSGLYESYIEEFGGFMEVTPDGYVHLYILAEHYVNGDKIRADLRTKLDEILSGRSLVREYIINPEGILLIKHYRNL